LIENEKRNELRFYLDPAIQAASSKTTQSSHEPIKPNDNPRKTGELLEMISNKQFKTLLSPNFFIPAGRSFFSLLQKNIFRFLQTSNNIDPFLREFGMLYEDIKQTGYDIPDEARALIHSILKGEYLYTENLLRIDDGRRIALEFLSSGQQEALPLPIVFVYVISLHLKSHKVTNIYVEEPEAHLFSDA
jgi:hypothetical protein